MKRRSIAALLSMCVLTCSGCLEREESIEVRPDGSATSTVVVEGDPTDVDTGDAMPTQEGGWSVTRQDRDDGWSVRRNNERRNDKLKLTATKMFPAGGVWDQSFAVTGEQLGVSLEFPTTLITEIRGDGIYYHFKRVYERRDDARYTLVRREFEKESHENSQRTLADLDVTTLTPEELAEFVQSLRAMEIEKQEQFLAAGAAALPEHGQDLSLRVRASMVTAAKDFDIQHVCDLLRQPQSSSRDAEIERAASEFKDSLDRAVSSALSREGLTEGELAAFRSAMEAEQRRRTVTEDLMDEDFRVTITMPGEIVASNGEASGHSVTWSFKGDALMDRDHVLMATSRLPVGNARNVRASKADKTMPTSESR